MNLVEAEVRGRAVAFGGLELPLAPGTDLSAFEGGRVILGIRPADLEDVAVWRNEDLPTIDVRADVTEELGSEVNVIFAIDAPPVATEELRAATSDEAGEEAIILADEEPRCVFVARVDARTRATPGATVTLSTSSTRRRAGRSTPGERSSRAERSGSAR
jgi:multiple sugar transport system ATP-binding protein